MDEENNSINNSNNVPVEINSINEVKENNKKDGNEIKISEKIVEIDLSKTNTDILTNNTNKTNNLSSGINYIEALNGLIVLILICMIAVGLSERFKRY
tara:strand:+ start:15613 stop:15906 length:294 start_codon:yes stop_codon:yes gene_type:complete